MMRAKLAVQNVVTNKDDSGATTSEQVTFGAVSGTFPYPADGSDENNTFARWTPCATLTMTINNPDLFGKFSVGKSFYADFTPAD